MSLIDGTFADAKTATAVGDSAEAKSNALVLAELARWLALDRNTPQWHEQSNDLVVAAEQAAASESNDPKELRAVFHNVYARCEACHALRRPQ
jgi:cytochrome c556